MGFVGTDREAGRTDRRVGAVRETFEVSREEGGAAISASNSETANAGAGGGPERLAICSMNPAKLSWAGSVGARDRLIPRAYRRLAAGR